MYVYVQGILLLQCAVHVTALQYSCVASITVALGLFLRPAPARPDLLDANRPGSFCCSARGGAVGWKPMGKSRAGAEPGCNARPCTGSCSRKRRRPLLRPAKLRRAVPCAASGFFTGKGFESLRAALRVRPPSARAAALRHASQRPGPRMRPDGHAAVRPGLGAGTHFFF